MSTTPLAARLDRMPVGGRFHRRVLAALAVAYVFEFGDLNTFAYTAPALKKHLHLSVDNIALITSASFLGMFIGATFGGRIADRFGRRRALMGAVTCFSIFSLVNAAAWDVPTLAAARLLTGIGLSAMVVTANSYLSEVMPTAHRGRMQAAVMTIGLLGIPGMSFLARGIIPLSPGSWRVVFVVGALGVLTLPLLARLPESPVWLHRHGAPERAEKVLHALERDAERDHGPLPTPVPTRKDAAPASPGYRALLRGSLGRRTLLLAVVWIFQTLGFYGFVAWVPTLLAAHGFDLAHSLTFSALTTLGAPLGALLAWPISDRIGRKHSIGAVAVVVASCGLAYGLTFNPVAIVLFGFCVNVAIQTFAALLYAYTPELFPTELRNSGHGLVYGLGRLSNIAGPLIVASIFNSFGYGPVFAYIAACWTVVAVAIIAFGPSTGTHTATQVNETERARPFAYPSEASGMA